MVEKWPSLINWIGGVKSNESRMRHKTTPFIVSRLSHFACLNPTDPRQQNHQTDPGERLGGLGSESARGVPTKIAKEAIF